MCQQTKVETAIPYYLRWMRHFPDVQAVASADMQLILEMWEGLGYYARARNIHKMARILVEQHHCQIPGDTKELIRLPGIGRYTAGAIASIAFNKDEIVLDGNVKRVLARFHHMTHPLESSIAEQRLISFAEAGLPPGRAGEYNQALMELGALVCLPRKPLCKTCPLEPGCESKRLGVPGEIPVRKSRKPIPEIQVAAAIIYQDGRYLLAQRPESGLLGGLWEFPGGKMETGETLTECLERELREELDAEIQVKNQSGTFRHAYTHFRVVLHAYQCALEPQCKLKPLLGQQFRWVPPNELFKYPMGKIDRMISRRIVEGLNDNNR